MPLRLSLALVVALAVAPSCRSAGGRKAGPRLAAGSYVLDTATGEKVSVTALVDALAVYDVVFLGELHDSDSAHALQNEVTRRLGERRPIVLSLEMFERDVQLWLDAYFVGAMTEDEFLAAARPWPNYVEHYRPAVEFARERGFAVLAANLPRPVARDIARSGRSAVESKWLPRYVDTSAGAYRDRFVDAMGGHGAGLEGEKLDDWYAAQCAKDDAMAESIVDHLARADGAPLVVHWCGRFHSDYGLGTVERLRSRRPDLAVAVVTTARPDGDLAADELEAAEWVFVVRD